MLSLNICLEFSSRSLHVYFVFPQKLMSCHRKPLEAPFRMEEPIIKIKAWLDVCCYGNQEI